MLKKFLKDVLIFVVGKQAEGMSDLLYSNKHVNEFLISKKLGITINQTRNILYKIADKGLVSSLRKKDKRKGWYTYFWKIEVLKSLEFLKTNILKRLEQLNSQLKSRESRQFYYCEKCNLEFNEENALLYDFTCRECGNVFVLKDNSKTVKDLKKEISKLEGELKLIELEIEQEKLKVDKVKIKEQKKINKLKEIKKKMLRKSAARAKKKAEKMLGPGMAKAKNEEKIFKKRIGKSFKEFKGKIKPKKLKKRR